MQGKKIVITGGAGAIGCNLVSHLLSLNPEKIIILDNLTSGNLNFLPQDERVKFIPIDLFFKDKLESSIPTDVDYIFHLAAHFANQNSVEFPLSDIQTNIIGTLNLLEVSKKINLSKIINCSSSCVYGDSQLMKEDSYVYPNETPYAINKLAGELYTSFYSEFHNVPTLNLRIFNTYGPFEVSGQYRNVIPNFINKALMGEPITITGDGSETRDFTFVSDTCELLVKMALSDKNNGSVYNGGTGIKTTIKELAETILDVTKSSSVINFSGKRRWDKVTNRLSDISKTKSTFIHPRT